MLKSESGIMDEELEMNKGIKGLDILEAKMIRFDDS